MWFDDAVFYHIYPLGLCDAEERNRGDLSPNPRLDRLLPWLDHMQALGATALLLGPVFESEAHGYDTIDLFNVDRRLGSNETLEHLAVEAKRRGLRLVLDAVFNHVGRGFWAFQQLLREGPRSPMCHWFSGLRWGQSNRRGDPFTYDTWDGHDELVKLNLSHADVRAHLLAAVDTWIQKLDIDGLRIDAADVIDPEFLATLRRHVDQRKEQFWLLGEMVLGDYNRLLDANLPDSGQRLLDSVTNYECYKGLYSSHNDHNYFELGYALNRQSAAGGIYEGHTLYSFADNHDVNRVATAVDDPRHLWPLYLLLFTMPGVPSVYYGSEWGVGGRRTSTSDRALRPALDLQRLAADPSLPGLVDTIAQLCKLRQRCVALRRGGYEQLHLEHELIVFERRQAEQRALVVVNASDMARQVSLPASWTRVELVDLLDPQRRPPDGATIDVPAGWGRVLVPAALDAASRPAV